MLRFFACIALFLLLSLPASAQIAAVPPLMNFQGRLAKPDGTPVPNGTYSLRFSLWDVASGGNAANEKWNETINPVTVKNGVFAVLLGNVSAFPATLFNTNLWLEIKVGADAALAPRQQVATVAYAFKANSVKDGGITGASIANGTITSNKLASNALAWLLTGNSGTSNNFIGTTDNVALELRSNNRRVMRYESVQTGSVSVIRSTNVLGGYGANTITAGVLGATIAGGGYANISISNGERPNTISSSYGSIGGGAGHTVGGIYGVVAGGLDNVIDGSYAALGGGTTNLSSGTASTVAGGDTNDARGTGDAIGGGESNSTNGPYATVPGGFDNTATGSYSFAAGRRARAFGDGSFVWADSVNAEFTSITDNEFRVRASGGIKLFTNAMLSSGVTLTAGDSGWNSVSDRNAKTDFRDIDSVEILERLVGIPLSTWRYKASETGLRHIGPMAQDFFAAFGVGTDDKHISTVDADGVAFAAIQGLYRKVKSMEADNTTLRAKNAELEARLSAIEKILRDRR